MNVEIEKISECKIKLNYVLDKNSFDDAFNNVFIKKKQNLEINNDMTKTQYIEEKGIETLYEDIIYYMINEAYTQTIKEKQLKIVSEPILTVNESTIGIDKNLSFSIEVEIYPNVELGEYLGLVIEKESIKVTNEDIDNYINDLLASQYANEVLINNRGLEIGDKAVFDFYGKINNVAFEGGTAKNYSLIIGSNKLIPGFEEQMIGMKVNEKKNIKVTFPDNYISTELKGKEAIFEIVLHQILERKTPQLTDEFIKETLKIENISTIQEYKIYIKNLIFNERKIAIENKFKDDCVAKAINNAKFAVPATLVNNEINNKVYELQQQAKNYNLPIELLLKYGGFENLEEYKNSIYPSSLYIVKERIVMNAIAVKENLEVSKSDYEKEIKLIIKENNKNEEEVRKQYTIEAISPYILLCKAIDLVVSNAIIKQK